MDGPTLITMTIARTVWLSKSGGLNLDGIYFTRAHAHRDSHGPTANLAVDDELGTAFAWVERNLEILPAMWTGDCQEFAHKPTITYVISFVNL